MIKHYFFAYIIYILLLIIISQNYNRMAPRLAIQVGRYAHARQYKRMNGSFRKLRTVVGRVWRDVERHAQGLSDQKQVEALKELCLVR